MKKIFAIMLAVCMLASVAALFSIPAAAANEAWVVYGNAKDYRDYFNEEYGDEYSNTPGYKYVNGVGLQTISPNWENTSPKIGVQTGSKVNLKNGVYMLVRIDEFSYEASDKWFAFSISDTQYVNVGSESAEDDGERVVALVRSDADKMSEVQWSYSNYKWGDRNYMTATDAEKFDENGKAMLEFIVTWDDANNSYSVTVNGAKIDNASLAWMNEHFADGEAYVGINIQNSEKGGEAGLTVLQFGENKLTALAPYYTDSQEPVNIEHLYHDAEIADPSTVEVGQPAVFINGSRLESDSKTTVRNDATTSLTEDGYIHIASDREEKRIGFSVKNTVSYDIKDFPVVVVLTKNFCNCVDKCWGLESASMYLMAGDDIAAGSDRKISNITPYGPVANVEDNYLYFMVNFADETATADAEGRINGIRFDPQNIDINTPGKNEFDICFAAFFRNEEEAESYVYSFLGVEQEDQDTETEAPTNTETEAPTNTETQAPANTETQAPANTETENKAPANTEAPVGGDDNASSGGCSGTVGFGVIAIVAVAAVAGFVTFKKKD